MWLRLSQQGRVCHQDRAHSVESELVVVGEVGQVQGQSPCGEERPKSSIAKRVRTRPRPQNPFSKRKYDNVYTSRKQAKKHGGVSATYVAGTDSNVSDESLLGSSDNANMEPIVWPVADEGFPTGELRVDDIDGCVFIWVAKEGAAEDAEGTTVSGDVEVDYVHNSIDQGGDGGHKSPWDVVVNAGVVVTDEKSDEGVAKDGPEVPTQSEKGATYDDPLVAGVDAIHCDTHGTKAETSTGTVDEGRDGSGNPSPVVVVVTTLDEDTSPTSSEAGHGRQSPPTRPLTCRQFDKGFGGGPSNDI
ncbi:LOW QUALITY PROTEIN: hypothetical protein Cgig2_007091 [Carnegiea gigantea]|uniref:Uncharacterized protein n=1 Tax=Carnegiea gigantea TaxID=171969 RepID=A0A9Q1JS93_9CARY|nr:LOW QUALITY PROTEIN: hypothetical protein Cgig2_007091 [Carnegiea gigantea]